ncbi:recombinase family protein, partial [Candidatus Peregrinibacteria bacterium]|nr:recombinase family protein [Candidatus Peregrinibacteria bacterium]
MKASIYTRVSTEEQKKGNSLEEQKKRCEHLVKSKGGDIFDVYEDGGKGGDNINRPQLQRLLEDAKMGKFDTIVIFKIDRLSRSLRDFLDLLQRFEKMKICLLSVTETIDTSNSIGRLLVNVLASFAEYEHETIKERINIGQIASMRKGRWKGSAPYGYDLKDKKLIINYTEAAVVRKIFNLFEKKDPLERLTLMKIQTLVNSWKIPTKRACNPSFPKTRNSETFWHASNIQNMLRNSVYTGQSYIRRRKKNTDPKIKKKKVLRPQDEWIPIETPKIINPALFQKVQGELNKNSEFSYRKSKGEAPMLSKLIFCCICGRKFTHDYSRGQRRYICQGRGSHLTESPCTSISFKAEKIERPVWDKLSMLLKNPVLLNKYLTRKPALENKNEQKKSFLIAEITFSSQKKERLVDLFLNGAISKERFKEQEADINLTMGKKERELRLLSQSLPTTPLVEEMSFDQRYNQLLQKIDSADEKIKRDLSL